MRFDTVIVGGGLSSLVCGIRLQREGKSCLIVSAGQNALHFSSGAFGLLGRLPDGSEVSDPMSAIGKLPSGHPYSKIGASRVAEYASAVPSFFASCGIELSSAGNLNGYRLTGMGTMKPAWLAMKDVTLFASKDEKIGDNVLIVNFAGYLDFNTGFIAEGLAKRGTRCRVERVGLAPIESLRKNPTVMRSVNIARIMSREENWKDFCRKVQGLMKGEDTVLLPEVFGFGEQIVTQWVREMIPAKVIFVGTMPPSVPGIRTQMLLKKAFEAAGGTFLAGDEVVGSSMEEGRVLSVRTSNLGDINLFADQFVLASGGIFGKGLVASPESVVEPVFGLDADYPPNREEWYSEDFFGKQAYSGIGVRTTEDFRAFRQGEPMENLRVIGAEAGGCNSLYEGSGAGVAILTAFSVAEEILKM